MKNSNAIERLILVICFFIASSAYGTTYYFSQSIGNNAWSGTLPNPNAGNTDGPKQSITALNTLLNTVAQPGDSVLLRRGDVWSGATGIQTGAAHGTPSSYILIGAYGTGSKPLIDKTGAGEVLLCRGSSAFASSYLKFQNLALTTSSAIGNRPTGVYVNESFYPLKPHHITFDSLEITGCLNGMILYQHHIIVENSYLYNNGNPAEGNGIYASSDSLIIRNNVLDSNGCGSVFAHSFYISQCDSILLEGNEIRNADDGFKLRSLTNVVVRNNVIHDMYIHAIHMGGDALSGTSNITVEGNLVYNSPQGLEIKSESGTQTLLSENITIKNNIFPAQVIVSNTCPVKDIFIYNNLIHSTNNQNALLYFLSPNPVNVKIKNNIFYKTTANANHALLSFASSSVFNEVAIDNNLYYFPGGNIIREGSNVYTALSSFTTAFPAQEMNGQQGNPYFSDAPNNNFHLTSLSALAIDKGADLTGVVTTDFDGSLRPVNGDGTGGAEWDIGPYEFSPSVGISTLNTENKIRIYPNPTGGEFTLTSIETPAAIVITDISGKILLERQTTLHQNKFNFEGYLSGIYFMNVIFKTGIYTLPIIKQE